MDEKYFLLTQEEYKELKVCLELAAEVGYSDITAKLAEDVAALYSIWSILDIANRSQQERIQTIEEVRK